MPVRIPLDVATVASAGAASCLAYPGDPARRSAVSKYGVGAGGRGSRCPLALDSQGGAGRGLAGIRAAGNGRVSRSVTPSAYASRLQIHLPKPPTEAALAVVATTIAPDFLRYPALR